ncbi:VP2 [Kummerowia striata gokushovirus]|nr:VP2 [Kummerowia striata gokushovirus]
MFIEQRLFRICHPTKEIAPLVGAGIVAGLGSLFGGAIAAGSQSDTNAQNLQISRENNQFNANQAQINRDYQTAMSNTAHVREVNDLRAAGLNPLLSANTGASSPGGATASSSGNPVMQNPFAQMGEAVSGFGGQLRDLMQLDMQGAQTQADVRVKDANAAATISNSSLDPSRKALMLQQIEESKFRSHPNSTDQLMARYMERLGRWVETNASKYKSKVEEGTHDFMKAMKPEDWSKLQNALEGKMKGGR